MSFSITVDKEYIKQKLKQHLKTIDPVCIDQIAQVIDGMNSNQASVIFKSLDGHVYQDLPWAINDRVMIHMRNLYTHRYNETAMKAVGIIDMQDCIECRILAVDKFTREVRVDYEYISNNEERAKTTWSVDVVNIEKTVGLERPNLNDLI